MPVYNSEEYLAHAIRSVLAQSYDALELILVDDGSTDKSGAICDDFADKDGRVVVLHQPNRGICGARNVGLDAARGVYVAFCDNDDEYLPGLVEDNVAIAEERGKDVVRFLRDHQIVLDGRVIRHEVVGEGRPALDLTGDALRDAYFDLMRYGGGVWTGLYRRELLNRHGIRFPEQMRYGYEDLYFNLLVVKATGNIAVNPRVYYRWVERYAHSTSRKFDVNRLDSIRLWLRLEGEVGQVYDLAQRHPEAWCAYLVDTHVIRMLQQLSLPMCDLTARQKSAQLKMLAEEEPLRRALRATSALRGKMGPKTRAIARLLKLRMYGALVGAFTLNARRTKRVY
jgi:glycosyltransferase involved in cell wall biosynthesis